MSERFDRAALRVLGITLQAEEAEALLQAIRSGTVDALVVNNGEGDRICTIQGADRIYRVIFEAMTEGAMILDGEGRVIVANPALAQLSGRSLEELGGIAAATLFEPEEGRARFGRADQQPARFELYLSHVGGDRRPVMVSLSPVPSNDVPVHVAMIGDLSANYRSRQALEEANSVLEQRVAERTAELHEANRAKDLFFNTLSHELRTPLAAMRNAAEVLGRAATQAQQAQATAVIHRAVKQQSRLIDDLLQLSRVMRGKIELEHVPVDLVELAHSELDVILPDARRAGVELHLEAAPLPLVVLADGLRMRQVLGNLLGNALKFTERGGSISVSALVEDGWAVIRVRDTGVGIIPETLPYIFEPFRQGREPLARRRGGLGIGLAIARSLTELQGGTLQASSAGEGMGSELELRLPLAAAAQLVDSGKRAPLTVLSRRVLLVEDNPDVRETMNNLLGILGHRVEVADCGGAALELATRVLPEIAVLDIGLPDMDGVELAIKLRGLPGLEKLRLIAISGYGGEQLQTRAAMAGFETYLLKPVNIEELEACLQSRPLPGLALDGLPVPIAACDPGE